MSSVIAYLGVKESASSDARLAILEYANRAALSQIEFCQEETTPRRRARARNNGVAAERLLDTLRPGHTVLVLSPLSFHSYLGYAEFLAGALGRGAAVHVIDIAGRARVFHGAPASWADAWAIMLEAGRHHATNSQRAIAARENGKRGGRRRGSIGRLKLDGREDEIRKFLRLELSDRKAARHLGVTPRTFAAYVKRRGLRPDGDPPASPE